MDGIINVYKEAGYTSFDVVAELRKLLKIKKIGHTGTLDPQARGVLPICVGKATKVVDILTDRDKTYKAQLVMGVQTDTLDMTGNIINIGSADIKKDELNIVLSHFSGEITQIPPMYSAVRVKGKRLYEYARQGIEIERRERKITIYSIEIIGDEYEYSTGNIINNIKENNNINTDKVPDHFPSYKLKVECSKGTYIRTLCDDIGKAVGCGAAMGELIRTKVGAFDIKDALKISQIEKILADASEGEDRTEILYREGVITPTDEIFSDYKKAYIKPSAEKKLTNGNPLQSGDFTDESTAAEMLRVYGTDNTFYAIYKKESDRYRVHKFFR